MNLPDLWDNCYEGEHRRLKSPEDFRAEFCGACMNAGCRNSRSSESKWSRRIRTQEDRLLVNPRFADENAAQRLWIVDFEDTLRQALALEVSTQKGDWSVPTDAEIGRAAAEMVGMVAPTGFQPATPEPPEPPKPPAPERWRVQGDSTDSRGRRHVYEVTRTSEGVWGCSCPSRETPCKHVRDIERRLARSPEPTPPTRSPEPTPPTRPAAPPGFRPSRNTATPAGGITLGNPPPASDPWAPKSPKGRVVPVGGRVTMGGNKRGSDDVD
jgi:hypothetical protein